MEKRGLPLVCQAVTFAASLLAQLKNSTGLDDRDKRSCLEVQKMLEQAEVVLYGRSAEEAES